MSENQNNEQHWQLLVLLIKEAADAKGISPANIAEFASVSRSTITRVFNLDFCPKLDIFIAMARAVGMNFYIEDQEGNSDMNLLFEKAMSAFGRRPDNKKSTEKQ